MSVCPQCASSGVPESGVCPVCGEDLEAPVLSDADETVSFDDLELVVATASAGTGYPAGDDRPAPSVEPVPVLQPTSAPIVEPILAPLEFEETDDVPPVVMPAGPVVIPADVPTGIPTDTDEEVEAAPVMVVPDEVTAHAFLDLSARYEFTSVPGDDPPLMGVMVEVTAEGSALVDAATGPVAHVILALDLSASMNHPDKYPVLRGAIASMLDDLTTQGAAEVLVSVVVFSMGAEVLLRAVAAHKINKDHLFRAIESNELCFGRYTDVAGALGKAGRIAYDQAREDRTLPVRIYLLTDGNPQDLDAARAASARCAKVPVDMHALAFGSDADVGILQELFAGRRGGTVKSVRRDTITGAFERVAEVARRVVATRCLIDVELAPGVVGGDAFRYRPGRTRYPEPAFEGGKRFSTDMGTLESDRTYSLLFEIRPPETEAQVTRLGAVRVRIPGHGGAIEKTLEMTLPRTDAGSLPGDTDTSVRTARDILGALTHADPQTALRALKLRRDLYEQERRDPGLLDILDKAIELLGATGSLDGLSLADQATLMAHTCTSGTDSDRGFR